MICRARLDYRAGLVGIVALTGCGPTVSTQAEGVSRADSVAVLGASLEQFLGAEDVTYFSSDTEPLVLSAGRAVASGEVQTTSARVFCSDDVAHEGEPVGLQLSVSLEPGDGPVQPPVDSADGEGRRGDYLTEPDIWYPAFYVDQEVGYVMISSGCWGSPGGTASSRSSIV